MSIVSEYSVNERTHTIFHQNSSSLIAKQRFDNARIEMMLFSWMWKRF